MRSRRKTHFKLQRHVVYSTVCAGACGLKIDGIYSFTEQTKQSIISCRPIGFYLFLFICLFFISSAQLQTDWFAIELTEHWNRNPRVQGATQNRKLGACIIYPDSCVPYWDSNSVAEWVFKYVWKRGTVILFFLYSLNHKRHRTSLNKITLKVPPRYTSNIFLINRSLCNATWSNVDKRQHVARCMASCESLWSPFGEVILRKLTASPCNEAIQNCRLQDNFIVTQRK